ncbi:MAG: hypothetical protein IIA87_03700 [Nanoarchaeota archaeon]|nr:hypothetical protein [Nanoarchaeota archaeon]
MPNNLNSVDFNLDHIFQHDGISSTLTGSFASPDVFPMGLTIDENGNLNSTDLTADHIFQHDGISSTLTGSFANPAGNPRDMTIDENGNLNSTDASVGFIFQHSGISPTLLGSFASPDGLPEGLTYDGSNLISTGTSADHIFQHSGISPTLLGSFATPKTTARGLGYDNPNLISSDDDFNFIFQHSGISPTLLGSFASPSSRPAGITIEIVGPTTHTISVSDTLSLTDTFTRGTWTLARSFTETLSISDSIAIFPTRTRKIIRDTLSFIKTDLLNNITDPASSSRPSNSRFIMSSYPTRSIHYPLVTIKVTNINVIRTGSQSNVQDVLLNLEIRIWARNEKEKDEIYTDIINRLNDIQLTGKGSIGNNLHDFNVLSSVEVDEEGESGGQIIKSRILQCQYSFYNIL